MANAFAHFSSGRFQSDHSFLFQLFLEGDTTHVLGKLSQEDSRRFDGEREPPSNRTISSAASRSA
jgi:hypothetical protein